jgi:hypothetical protein
MLPESALTGDVPVDAEKLDRLGRICNAFLEVRSLLGTLIHDNWTLAELAEAKKLPVEIVMGDQFSNIVNTTIVNRSILENSFVKLKETDPSTADALRQVAAQVESSGSEAAGALFDAFNGELQQREPRKPVLASLWSGISTAVPTLAQMTDVVVRVSKLFG